MAKMTSKDFEGFKILEEKIGKAADMIQKLRDEKNKADEENKKLKEEIKMLYTKNEELKKEVERLQDDRQNHEDFDRVREEISNRIEVMLGKLDRIEI